MKKLILMGLGLAVSLSTSFAVVKVKDAKVLEIHITKWKGNWSAPGYKQMKDIVVEIKDWELVNEEKNDKKVVEALEKSGGKIKLRMRNYPINGSMDTSDYDWLKKHKKWFRDTTNTELNFTGELSWQHLDMGWAANKKGVVLHAPHFKSKHGELKLRDSRQNAESPSSSNELKLKKNVEQQEKFEKVY